jgi:hypothetical protein
MINFVESIHRPDCFWNDVSETALCLRPQVKRLSCWAQSTELAGLRISIVYEVDSLFGNYAAVMVISLSLYVGKDLICIANLSEFKQRSQIHSAWFK